MGTLLLGIGLVLAVEGLVLALAPSRLLQALELLRALSPEQRRLAGLSALALGVLLVALSRALGG
jgi:uncharacterized protein YjeT (DUF2065 family)